MSATKDSVEDLREARAHLDDGHVEERPAQADGERGGGHDGGAREEPDGHREGGDGVAAGDDSRLQRHEQPWAPQKKTS